MPLWLPPVDHVVGVMHDHGRIEVPASVVDIEIFATRFHEPNGCSVSGERRKAQDVRHTLSALLTTCHVLRMHVLCAAAGIPP